MERSTIGYGTVRWRTMSGVMLACLACLMFTGESVFGQFGGQGNRPINRAQEAVRTRLQDDIARDANIFFNNDTTEQSVSNVETRVTGTGVATRPYGARRTFYYDTVVNRRNGNVTSVRYDWRGNWDGGSGGYRPGGGNRPGDYQQGVGFEQAQSAVRARVQREVGRNASVYFNNDASESFVNNNQTRITGTGYITDNNNRRRSFSYEATVNRRNGYVINSRHDWRGNWDGGGGYRPGGDYRPGGGWGGTRPPGAVRFRGPITNDNSGKSLDVAGESREDGANVQQWDYARQDNQEWEIISVGRNEFAIVNRNSNRVLDVADTNINDNGANVQQYRWSARDNQRWRLESVGGGLYRIVNVASGRCLDVDEQSRSNGANVHQWRCGNERSQRWRVGN